MPEKLAACVMVRKDVERLERFWGPRQRSMTQCEAFLAGDRYEIDNGTQNRDRRLSQIRGQETQDTIRHIVGELTAKPRQIEARGIDNDSDQDQAEVEVALLEFELDHLRLYKKARYRAIQSAREKRLGVVWMDWDPDCGPYGEILYSEQDPRRVMWEPAYDPHHPHCDVLVRTRRINTEKARKTYKAPWLQSDRSGAHDSEGRLRPGVPLLRGVDGEAINANDFSDNETTIWEAWYKNDRTTKTRDVKGSGPVPFENPDDIYSACTGCGEYRTPNQGALADMAETPPTDVGEERIVSAFIDNGNELPEEIPEGCPKCGGTLERVEAKNPQEDVLAYSRGKRLVVMAPCSPGPDDKPLYDGAWPIPKARSFPALFVYAYEKPGEPVGPCDVDLMWDQQIACDNLRTIALQRTFEHRNYWVMPKAGITDGKNLRFEHREDQFNVMYRDASIGFDTRVEMLNGTGLDPMFPQTFQIMNAALTQYRGVADFGLTPESSKNIPVGTVQTIERQENIPIADAKRRLNEEDGKFYGVVSDYIHAVYTPDRLARLRIDGVDLVVGLWGQDLPNYDFIVEESPEFTGLEKTRSDAWAALWQTYAQAMQAGLDPMQAVEIFADINQFPRSTVRKFQKMLQDQKTAQEAATEVPPEDGGGAQDILKALMGEGDGEQAQPNGAGMESAPAA